MVLASGVNGLDGLERIIDVHKHLKAEIMAFHGFKRQIQRCFSLKDPLEILSTAPTSLNYASDSNILFS